MVREVRTGNELERTFVEEHAPLYVDLADLSEVLRRIEARRDYEVAKEQGALARRRPSRRRRSTCRTSRSKYDTARLRQARSESGRFSDPARSTSRCSSSRPASSRPARTRRARCSSASRPTCARSGARARTRPGCASATAPTSPSRSRSSTRSRPTSRSRRSSSSCSRSSVIVLYYRWWRAIAVLFPPLLLATVYAFGLASLPPANVTDAQLEHRVPGLDHRRQRDQRRHRAARAVPRGAARRAGGRRRARRRHLGRAARHARGGARGRRLVRVARAHRVPRLPPVRRHRRHGAGRLVGDGVRPHAARSSSGSTTTTPRPCRRPRCRARDHGARRHASSSAGRCPSWSAALAMTVGSVVAVVALRRARRSSSTTSPSCAASTPGRTATATGARKVDSLLGRYLTPTVVMTDSTERPPPRPRDHPRGGRPRRRSTTMVASVRGVDDVLPDGPAGQDRRRRGRSASDLTPKIRSLVDEDKRDKLDELLGPERPGAHHAVGAAALVHDGAARARRLGRAHRARLPAALGHPLAGRRPSTSSSRRSCARRAGAWPGPIPLSDDIIGSISRDAPVASLASFVGVVVIVLVVLRGRREAAATSSARCSWACSGWPGRRWRSA